MLQLSGEEQFSQAPEEIWDRVVDPEFLVKIIPGVDHVEQVESDRLVCRVRPGLSFMTGTLKITIDISAEQPQEMVRMHVASKGIGSSAMVETAFHLAADDTGTKLDWTADVTEVGGLLKPVGRTLIGAAARKVISDAWLGFRNELDQVTESAAPSS
ncbi:MAG: hypothetical protein GY903_03375 [Fuerstiella sp.]|nr:hypothetical protein [Fuerstiella sp.]